MKSLLKQKLKDRLQRTRQSARNKESRTLDLETIGKLCRHGRIIYYSSKQNGKNGFVIVSERINFNSFSCQMAVHLTLFVSFLSLFLIKLLERYLLPGSIASNYYQSRVSIDPCYKLFKIVYILIRQEGPLKKPTLIFQMTFQTFQILQSS